MKTPLFQSVFCLLSSVLCFLPLEGHACIGDTKPQLAVRYGPGKEVGYQILYAYRDMTVNVFFDKDQKSAMEVFSKRFDTGGKPLEGTKEEMFEKQPQLTQDEIDQILKENGGNFGWGGMRSANGSDFWYRGDKKVIAQYKKQEKAMVLMSID
jgi:hypothetical protein